MKKLLLAASLLLAVSGCGMVDSMQNGLAHSEAVATDLEKSIGQKPFVGFNWNNGSLTNVNVTFSGVPANHSLNEIYQAARHSIAAQFKQEPKQVVISFAFGG